MSQPVPRPRILDIEPYVPGESAAPSGARLIRLAANENPFGTSEKVREAFRSLADGLHRYPDGGSVLLRRKLAAFHRLEENRIVCGTGSDELISLLCRAFTGPGDEVVYSEFGFLMYPLAALSCGATPVKARETERRTDFDALLAAVTAKTRLVFLANPNNPTGCLVKRSEIRAFRERLREDILLVVDAAYAEYVTDDDCSDGSDLVREFDNVVMLRTFSKVYGLSSLRVGWSYSSEFVAGILNRVRGVFNINTAGQVCAAAALDDQDFIRASVESNSRERHEACEALARLGYTVYPSGGNFILFSLGSEDRAGTMLRSLKEQGILLRGMTAYHLPDCLRMTVGTPEDMTEVLAMIEKLSA